MFAFNLWSYTKSNRDLTQRFFAVFQIAAAVPFVLAYLARALHLWDYLRLMPLRSFPLIVPLVFFFQAFRYARRSRRQPTTSRSKAAARPARRRAASSSPRSRSRCFPTSPLFAGPRMIRRNFIAWTTVDHMAEAFDWIRENTPTDTRCIFPVDRQDAFDRAERAAGRRTGRRSPTTACRSGRRASTISSAAPSTSPDRAGTATSRTSATRTTGSRTAQVDRIATKYDATCFVSETDRTRSRSCTATATCASTRSCRPDGTLGEPSGPRDSVDSAGVSSPVRLPELTMIGVIDYRAGQRPERDVRARPPRPRRRASSPSRTASTTVDRLILPGVGAGPGHPRVASRSPS